MAEQRLNVISLSPNETWRIKKNVVVVTLAFMIHYTAVHGICNLQSSINAEEGLGTGALTTMFAGVLISNIFFTSIVIKWLGPKWTMCVSMMTYMPFIVAQLYPSFSTLMPSGLLMGLGSAVLLCAKSTYVSVLAEALGMITKLPSSKYLLGFSGLFFMFVHMSQIWGNLLSSLVLSNENNSSMTSVEEHLIPEVCGSNFLPNLDAADALPSQPPEKIFLLTGIYFALIVAALLLTVFGLDSMKRYQFCRTANANDSLSGLALLAATFRQLRNRNQQLLLALNIFIGLQQAFLFADYTSSFVACAIGTGSVGFVMMYYGISNVLGCLIMVCLPKFKRLTLMITALIIHGSILVTLLTWRPHAGESYIMFIISILWGITDSIWIVQINTYYGILFPGKEEAAYSNLGLWEGVGYIISLGVSAFIRTRYKVYLLICNLLLGFTGYLIVEYREHKKDRNIKKIKSIDEEGIQTEKEKLTHEQQQSLGGHSYS